MLNDMRTSRGTPNVAVRLLALLVVLGLVLATAPVVVVPLVRWAYQLVL